MIDYAKDLTSCLFSLVDFSFVFFSFPNNESTSSLMNQLRKFDSYRDSIGRSVDSCSSEFGERLQRRRVVSAMLNGKIEYSSK